MLRNINLEIAKGSRVGIIGATGSGKSTLVNILMGLLHPSDGKLSVDGLDLEPANILAWQSLISHVPQTIFLADATIAENIGFGIPFEEIDMIRVEKSAQQAQIAQTIEGWHDGYKTIVGERGVRLSGGQQQRIGIARALYRRAQIIFFDEATSALDNETEEAVIKTLEAMGHEITLFIIAHRLTTLTCCDLVLEVAEGVVGPVSAEKKKNFR